MIVWLVAVAIVLLDAGAKALIVMNFAPSESRLAIPHLLWWTYVRNEHGAFGLFGHSPIVLTALALGVLAIFAYSFRDRLRTSRWMQAAFGLILGGALGNIADRLQHGWVVDFIDFRTIWPNVFNVGDSAITIGVAVLAIASFVADRREAR